MKPGVMWNQRVAVALFGWLVIPVAAVIVLVVFLVHGIAIASDTVATYFAAKIDREKGGRYAG